MARLGLLIYLTLVTLAGPSLCCCTAAQVMTQLHPQPAGQLASGHPGCACRFSAAKTGHSGNHEAASHSQHAPGSDRPCEHDPCPAKQYQSLQVILPSESGALRQVDTLDVFSLGIDLCSWHVSGTKAAVHTALPSTQESHSFPYMTCRDILRAIQILRC